MFWNISYVCFLAHKHLIESTYGYFPCTVHGSYYTAPPPHTHTHAHTLIPQRVDESSAYYQEEVRQAKQIMTPFTLRRLKSQVLSQLPAKVSSTEHCQLTETQWTLYRGMVERSLRVNLRADMAW